MATPSPYGYLKPRPPIYGSLVLSAAFHAGMVALLAWWSGQTRPRIDLTDRAIITRLVRLGERRDPRLLPVKPKALAPPPASPKAVALDNGAPKPDSPTVSRRTEDRKKRMEDALAAIMGEKSTRTPEGDPEGVPGGELTDAEKAQIGNRYFTRIYRRIKSNYTLPSIISDKERLYLKASVVIYIDQVGTIIRWELDERSGNDHFDNAITAAIRKSSPLPSPPLPLRDGFREEGILVTFRP